MLAVNVIPELILGTPMGISVYSVSQDKAHYHEGFLEILFCLKGTVTARILHDELTLSPGDVISCDSHDTRFLSCEEENLVASFYLDLHSPLFEKPELPHLFFVCQKDDIRVDKLEKLRELKLHLLTALYFYIFQAYTDADIFKDLAKKIMNQMLTHYHFFDYLSNMPVFSKEAKSRFERIIVYIHEHYNEKITVAKLSEIEHLNENYLSHFFKKTSFLGLSNYVNYVRIYESELLLLSTHKNISEIAYEVGFSDPKFYYKIFKEWYHHTPLSHRKHYTQYKNDAKKNIYYTPEEISGELAPYIAYYFATLQLL